MGRGESCVASCAIDQKTQSINPERRLLQRRPTASLCHQVQAIFCFCFEGDELILPATFIEVQLNQNRKEYSVAKRKKTAVSRRGFLKGAAVSAVSGAAAIVAPPIA